MRKLSIYNFVLFFVIFFSSSFIEKKITVADNHRIEGSWFIFHNNNSLNLIVPSVGFDCINGIFEHTNIPIPVYGVAVPHSFIPPNSPYVGVTIQLPIGFTTGIITIMEDNTIIISNNVSGSGTFYEFIINNPGQRRFSIFLN